jgi:hypothetical protein
MGLTNQAKILRGAFVEFGISVPPLIVVFQFNPLTISRTRTATYQKRSTPAGKKGAQESGFLQQIKSKPGTLVSFRDPAQVVTVNPETLSFDIRLDATDKLNDGDALTEQFGVAPQLSTLELMMLPKGQGILMGAVSQLLGGDKKSFAFFDDAKNPPVILFIWGRKKVMPVNITNMQVKEEEFSTDLNPTRATVTVSLEVIEGPNAPFLYTKALKETMSLLNLANIGDVAGAIVPA